MKQKLNLLFTLLCLATTSVVTIATSSKSDHKPLYASDIEKSRNAVRTNYLVASNCPNAVQNASITVADNVIEYPSNFYFTTLGLPAAGNLMDPKNTQSISDLMNGHLRSCTRSEVQDQGVNLILYSCTENNVAVCQVTFEVK